VIATYACAAGIELLLGVGLDAVHARIEHLTARIAEGALARGWPLVTPAAPDKHGAMMTIAAKDAPALVEALAADCIVVSDRGGNLRISPHAYNNDDDIDILLRALENNRQLMQ
jgi:selenocysteine lyase/cysteine desulfurase